MSKGVELIAAERKRQVEVEGWTAEHDQQHVNGEIADAAAAYAASEPVYYLSKSGRFFGLWPWSKRWYKPKDRLSNLVRAGALIAAEIDRLIAQEVDEQEYQAAEADEVKRDGVV